MPDDTIFIRNLSFDTIIGVLPHERTEPQTIIINLAVTVDIQTAARSENLQDTLDYADLAQRVIDLTQQSKCLLVETLAEKIADLTLNSPLAQAVQVEITKPQALSAAEGVGVTIFRSR